MEEKVLKKINLIRDNKIYGMAVSILFPVILVIYSLCRVNQGMDITDSTYSLTNFQTMSTLDNMWYYSTFYANLLGGLLVSLPVGKSLLWMNLLTGLIKTLTALLAYYFFTKVVKIERELAFFGTMISLGLCWCPTTILYNYLTYLFFFAGCVFLYKGLTEDKKKDLVFAGFFLGCNFFVRLPNLCEVSLIFALWVYSLIKKDSFKDSLMKTLCCVGGYFAAFIPAAILIGVTRGFTAYFQGIQDLFSMQSEASDYSTYGQLYSLAKTYISTWPYMEIAFFMVITALLAFLVFPTALTWARYVLATFTTLFFGVLLYRNGLTTMQYADYPSIYMFSNLMLVIITIWMIVVLFTRKSTPNERLLAVMTLIIVAISPLGSNNATYTNFNNMFFVMPVFLYLLVRFVKTNEHLRGIRYSVLLLTGVFLVQAFLFGVFFSFRDGTNGEKRNYSVTYFDAQEGMKTTETHGNEWKELADLYNKENLSGKDLLLYGDVSGMGYYLDEGIAISTAWPSLGSFSTEKYAKDMEKLSTEVSSKTKSFPVVFVGKAEEFGVLEAPYNAKQEILKEFLEEYEYNVIYSNDSYVVLTTSR